MSDDPAQPPAQAVVACTVSRDVRNFEQLIGDMEAALGERWGDLGFAEARQFLQQPGAGSLDFLAVALDAEDEANLEPVLEVIAAAKGRGVKVVLIAKDVSPAVLHQLLRRGGDEFVPYPLPEGELARAIARVNEAPDAPPPAAAVLPGPGPRLKSGGDRGGVVIPVYGMAGGTGATTLAVNLAWELAILDRRADTRVCLMDLGLQSGAVATYLDLPRREAVLEVLSDTETMDADAFLGALQPFGGTRLHVLTAPVDLVPLDLVGPADVQRLIEAARAHFDYVVIDMPPAMADWAEAVLQAAHLALATLELDMRCAQNVLRLKRALLSEGLPFEKLRFVLNRAPGFADLQGRARIKRLAESLGISVEVRLPDGGRQAAQAGDQGTPLAEGAARSPLRREIAKLAKSIHEVNAGEGRAPQARRA